METVTHSVRVAAPGDGRAVGLLAALALEHTDESVRGPASRGKNLLTLIDARGGVIRTRIGHTICRVAVDQQNTVVGMAHVCPPRDWIEDHPIELRQHLGQAVVELGMLAVDATCQGRGVGRSLLATVEEDERTRGTVVLFAKVALDNWSSLRWYRKQGFVIAAPGESFLVHTTEGDSNLVDLNDGHALLYKPMQLEVRILRNRLLDGSPVLHLSSHPVDSQYGRLFANA